jgi:uncharacterized membrane protein YphA (DoxX/SURF4 family)
MNTILWIGQIILAFVFLGSGIAKSTFSRKKFIETKQTGVIDLPLPVTRFIGISEIIGVAGLILPGLLQVAPVIAPVAASGLGIIMILAAIKHNKLKEPKNVRTNIILLTVCLFVAIGRLIIDNR